MAAARPPSSGGASRAGARTGNLAGSRAGTASPTRRVRSPPSRPARAILLAAGLLLPPIAAAAPPAPVVVAVLAPGGALPGRDAAVAGARAAVLRLASDLGAKDGTLVEVRAREYDPVSGASLRKAVLEVGRERPLGVLLVPAPDLRDETDDAIRSLRVPWFVVAPGLDPDLDLCRGRVIHLAPSAAAEAVFAADALLAPLGARRVGILVEPTARGRALAAGLERNLSRFVARTGTAELRRLSRLLPGGTSITGEIDPAVLAAARAREADWIYVAAGGEVVSSLLASIEGGAVPARFLFADGNAAASLLDRFPPALLEGSVFLDGPDPELTGRAGEALAETLERAGVPLDPVAVRAFEGARRLLAAWMQAGSAQPTRVLEALAGGAGGSGVLGPVAHEPHGGIRSFPLRLQLVRSGRLASWPDGLLPTEGCGPPIGFGVPPPAPVNEEHGRLGYLTYGEGEQRTIEADLLALGLSTGGEVPDLDRAVRDEILGRAARIAHRLVRREADGTPIPGWSFGLTFSSAPPPDTLPRSRVWTALVAGDHPAAGGQVIGSNLVAVYATFLRRTMYASRRLDPPLSAADAGLFDGTVRWGEDRTANFRANLVRCLMDGYASAMGLTTCHEFGHLGGCGHDTEAPTSIMNVVAGAGAAWENAVWIPAHAKSMATALGLESAR